MRIRYLYSRISGLPGGRRRRGRVGLLLIAAAAAALILLLSALSRMRPVLVDIADASVTDVVSNAVNDVINETMRDEGLDYNSLVTLEKDADGRVTALVTNMARINTLQTEISNRVIGKLADRESTVVRIPMGNLLGGALLSGRGPRIPVKILSVSNVNTDFSNAFTAAGINQTRHQMMLNVDVEVKMLLPGGSEPADVSTQVCIAETVIIGGVPETYADIGTQADGE